jgi:hypothetical protein
MELRRLVTGAQKTGIRSEFSLLLGDFQTFGMCAASHKTVF